MSPGLFQVAVVVGLIVLLFGSQHLGRWGWQLGRAVGVLRGAEGGGFKAATEVRRLRRLKRGGLPWMR